MPTGESGGKLRSVGSVTWDAEIAAAYDETYRALAEPAVVDPMVSVLAGLAEGGPVLEFAAGTGRVALPLAAQGIPVRGVELSPHMAERMDRMGPRAVHLGQRQPGRRIRETPLTAGRRLTPAQPSGKAPRPPEASGPRAGR